MIVKLYCVLDEQDSYGGSSIVVEENQSIEELRTIIKNEFSLLATIDPSLLRLWRVDLSPDVYVCKLTDIANEEKKCLHPLKPVREYFQPGESHHIRVIIEIRGRRSYIYYS